MLPVLLYGSIYNMVLLCVAPVLQYKLHIEVWCCSVLQYISMALPVLPYRSMVLLCVAAVLQYISMVLPYRSMVLLCVAIYKYGVARVAIYEYGVVRVAPV